MPVAGAARGERLVEAGSTFLSSSPTVKSSFPRSLCAFVTFDDAAYYVDSGHNYMRNLCIDSWRGARDANSRLEFITVAESRLFIMYDRPEALDRALDSFLRRTEK